MKKSVLFSTMGMLACCAGGVGAQEVGRVISSTPVIQQVAVPRQVCSNQPMVVQQPNTGAGAVIGGIAGGVVGNQIGHGGGRAAATALGIVGGALLGNNVEGRGQQVQNVPQCTTQTSYDNRTVGYDVRYEYAGREYNVQMPYDPGPSIRVQVSPMGSYDAPPDTVAAGSYDPGVVVAPQPAVVAPPGAVAGYPVYSYPQPVYSPYYPSYPPVGISLGFGFSSGHRHGHWR